MRSHRFSAVLLTLCFLAVPHLTAYAAPAREGLRPATATASIASRDLPRELVAAVVKFIRSITEKSGCAVDPLGRCLPSNTTTATPVYPSNAPEESLDLR